MAKFDTNVEVILEQVNPTVCTSLDIAPLSQHDYEILDECSDEVEQVFLQQIRLVFPSMKFPLWVSPNVCVDFRVGAVLPTTNEAILLLPSTQLHVLSAIQESKSSIEKELLRKTLKSDPGFPNILGLIGSSHLQSPFEFPEKVLRVLPSAFSNLVFERNKSLDSSIGSNIYILGEGLASETSNYATRGIMSMRSQLNPSVVEFVLVEVISRANISRSSRSKSLLKFLEVYPKPIHCLAVSKYCLAYSTVSLRRLEKQQIIRVNSVDISLSKEDMEWILNSELKSEVCSALRRIVLIQPLLFPFTGLSQRVSVKGKSAETIEKILVDGIKSLSKRTPSFLILDDFEFLSQSTGEGQRHLSTERILHLLRRLMSRSAIPLVIVARQSKSFHQLVVKPGGRRLFAFIKNLPSPKQKESCRVLHELLKSNYDSSIAVEAMEGLQVSNMQHLATRMEVEAKIRAHSSPVMECDFTRALACSRSVIQFGAKGRSETKSSLDDVGGLEAEKRILLEVLMWPTKHARVLDAYGIRLGKGVLLHGPSGCGKTLLAKAVVAHSKFNSIFIKGPELLSKFIGSSEGNVRNVFERARASSPCVIIFDELDSLAPQRGSDSTGVTDRVVNQLLTEMDGVESKSGIFVIGCSSRVDLIDSALLRPGRFDHVLECRVPNENDRADILKVLLRSVNHDPTVLCDEWASRTDGWTGVDLKALITNAQFDAMRNSSLDQQREDVAIRNVNVERAFNEFSPIRRVEQNRSGVGRKLRYGDA